MKKLFLVLLLVAQPLFAQQSHPLSEITPIDTNLNMGSYNISTEDLTVNGRDIWMGGASGQVWGLRYSTNYPDFGIFYLEGTPDIFAISPSGGGTGTPDLKISGNGNVTVRNYLIVNGAGVVLPANSVNSSEVSFNYASSGSKGGAASDLSCTNCVALGTETSGNYAGSNSEGGGANSCNGDKTCEANNITVTEDLTVDSNTLVVDGSANSVSIGGSLDVSGDATVNGNDLIFGAGESLTGIAANSLGFLQNSADDNNYEWVGFYSGASRKGIILWDGSWGNCLNSASEWCVAADSGFDLTLSSEADVRVKIDADNNGAQYFRIYNGAGTDVAHIDESGNMQIDGDLTVTGASTNFQNAIKAVDGSGSGIDADSVDGISSGSFLRSDAADAWSGELNADNTGSLFFGSTAKGLGFQSDGIYFKVSKNGATSGLPFYIMNDIPTTYIYSPEIYLGGYPPSYRSWIYFRQNIVVFGEDGGGDSEVLFYDDNSNTYRSFFWDDSQNAWYAETNSGDSYPLQLGGDKVWGEGRYGATVYGTTGAGTGLCDNGAIHYGLSKGATTFGGAAAACPANYWVCSYSDRGGGSGTCDTTRPDYLDDGIYCDGSNIDFSSSNHEGWTTNWDGATISTVEAIAVKENGNYYVRDTCDTIPVWCCTYTDA